jgi:UDP-N-acetylmuramoyl-L-alanyl-D-glutamate--2,6-diaminopimelate ligase
MLERILRFTEKLIPKRLYKTGQPIYHFLLAILGMIIYNFPARKMTIIAVTGTKGKTSTANFIHSVLNEGSEKVGLISTANIKIGSLEKENKYHMSMPGRFILQKFLKEMLKEKCKYCVVEATSEGVKQFRHLGLFIDISIFTNLSPEHLASHGNSFEKYRETKMRIFKRSFFNKLKTILVNSDDKSFEYFLNADNKGLEKIKFSLNDLKNISENEDGVEFDFIENDKLEKYKLNILGKFNVYNALPAIILGKKFGLDHEKIQNGLSKLNLIPGRMEEIKEGQDFKVIVDYAHEKLSINTLLDTAQNLKNNENNKTIIALGGDGGGRDRQRLTDMGEAVGQKADYIIITNSDPYFDDQKNLADIIKNEATKQNNIRVDNLKNNLEKLEENKNIFVILDREEGVRKACELAKSGDVVLLATRGSLNTMSIMGEKVKSDDREIVKRILKLNLKK